MSSRGTNSPELIRNSSSDEKAVVQEQMMLSVILKAMQSCLVHTQSEASAAGEADVDICPARLGYK